jgi:hypothetical protein
VQASQAEVEVELSSETFLQLPPQHSWLAVQKVKKLRTNSTKPVPDEFVSHGGCG